jgi:hypothetical protein
MLIEYDQSTMANMTAALDSVCKHIPLGCDTSELRKRIADAMIVSARAGRKNFVDFRAAGMTVVVELRATGRKSASVMQTIRSLFSR